MKINKLVIIIFLVSFLSQVLLALMDSPVLVWDENAYLATAKKFLGIGKYTEEFRFPLLYWLLVPLIYLFGENVFLIKIFLILIFSLSVTYLFKLFERFYPDSWKNCLIVLFLLLNGLIIFWGHRIYPDVLAMSLSTFFIYFFYKFDNNRKEKYLVLTSLFFVLAFLAKFYYALMFIPVFFYLDKKSRIRYWSYTILFITPWLIYNFVLYGNPFWNLIEQFKAGYMWQNPEPLSKFIENIVNYVGLLLIPLLFYKLLSKREKVVYYIVLIFLIYFSLFVKMKDPRYLLTILPFTMILIRATIDKIPSTMLILFLLYGFSTGYSLFKGISKVIEYNTCWDGADVISFTIYYLKNHNATSVISNCCWVWIANYLNIEAYSLWTENITYLIESYNPDYIVCGNFGLNINCNFNLEKVVDYEDSCGNWVIIYRVK